MKIISTVLVFAVALAAAGCAKKTVSEQLRDDMKKAGKQLNNDIKKAFK